MLLAAVGTWCLSGSEYNIRVLWPAIVAIGFIVVTRHVFAALLLGAFCGSLLLSSGGVGEAMASLVSRDLAPHFSSHWKVGGLVFTLLLGGFASILEKGGGFVSLIERFVHKRSHASRDLQTGIYSLGIICFFDGLANSMLVGRVGRKPAEACGVSREKLSYITDTTSSSIACVAFMSTWIAAQLGYIESAFAGIGQDVNPLLYFWKSLPYNFYCWFALFVLWVSVRYRFNPGPMSACEDRAVASVKDAVPDGSGGNMRSALIPLAVLLISMLCGFYWLGIGEVENPANLTFTQKLVAAMGASTGPDAMVLAAVMGVATASLMYLKSGVGLKGVYRAFSEGAMSMIMPLLILVAAWMLGSVLHELGAAEWIASSMGRGVALGVLPALVFLCGAIMSFITGTSWGTMGMMMPLAVPLVSGHPDLAASNDAVMYYSMTIAAVFSGAVFGDHCSPFSDTTIVTSIACGIEPYDHVRTQLPFALIGALMALLFGFIPVGFGFPYLLAYVLAGVLLLVYARRKYLLARQTRP